MRTVTLVENKGWEESCCQCEDLGFQSETKVLEVSN